MNVKWLNRGHQGRYMVTCITYDGQYIEHRLDVFLAPWTYLVVTNSVERSVSYHLHSLKEYRG